jgi:unconventional prefoldin RPB5 interactor 1
MAEPTGNDASEPALERAQHYRFWVVAPDGREMVSAVVEVDPNAEGDPEHDPASSKEELEQKQKAEAKKHDEELKKLHVEQEEQQAADLEPFHQHVAAKQEEAFDAKSEAELKSSEAEHKAKAVEEVDKKKEEHAREQEKRREAIQQGFASKLQNLLQTELPKLEQLHLAKIARFAAGHAKELHEAVAQKLSDFAEKQGKDLLEAQKPMLERHHQALVEVEQKAGEDFERDHIGAIAQLGKEQLLELTDLLARPEVQTKEKREQAYENFKRGHAEDVPIRAAAVLEGKLRQLRGAKGQLIEEQLAERKTSLKELLQQQLKERLDAEQGIRQQALEEATSTTQEMLQSLFAEKQKQEQDLRSRVDKELGESLAKSKEEGRALLEEALGHLTGQQKQQLEKTLAGKKQELEGKKQELIERAKKWAAESQKKSLESLAKLQAKAKSWFSSRVAQVHGREMERHDDWFDKKNQQKAAQKQAKARKHP